MRYRSLIVFSAALPLLACTNPTVNTESYLADSRHTAKAFMQTLGGALKKQIKADGMASAIPVCQQIAPATAAQFSSSQKSVKRVSTKARNQQQGIPDQWELNALQSFENTLRHQSKVNNLELYEVVNQGNERLFRYAKAIRIKSVCLNCHGQAKDIKPDVRASLAKHYPNDVARGYKLGELRGAISIMQKIAN